MAPLKQLTKEEAIELTKGPYATIVEKTISASIAPFLWRERDEGGQVRIRNGTAFFVSAERTGWLVESGRIGVSRSLGGRT